MRRKRIVTLDQLEVIAFGARLAVVADGSWWRLSKPLDGVRYYAPREA